ncbi:MULTISPECIES: fused MFS/spermidine synthase [Sphingobium]|jgi:spermidine synthase|uniref:Spermidine synthase n=2 Tax=Sphingobium TaxID=165695 RepID=A0A401J4U0_SPHXE|nr:MULTISPECIES: fused MFS/spermidine synthase [Sphingobium]GBH31594.1 spermidine synthase [Sphingobium xenophagum]
MTDAAGDLPDLDMDLFYDVVFAMGFDRPEPGFSRQQPSARGGHIPIALDAPFGERGPMLFRFGDMLSLLFNWSTVQSGMRVSDPDHLLFDYTRMMMAFRLFRPDPCRIEMIGFGGGSLAKACYRALPDCDISVVEIDPQVIALRERFRIPDDDHRFRVIHADGVEFVSKDPGRPDVLLVDGFDSRGLPKSLSTAQFYSACRARLSPDGLLVANLCNNFLSYSRLLRRIRAAFNGQALSVVAENGGNRIVFASADPTFPPTSSPFQSLPDRLLADRTIDYGAKQRRIGPALRRWHVKAGV